MLWAKKICIKNTLPFSNASDLKFFKSIIEKLNNSPKLQTKGSEIVFDAEDCSNTANNKTSSPKMILQNFN